MVVRKKKKFQEYAIIIGFLALVFVPGIAWFLFGQMIGESTTEKRVLAAEPVFDIRMMESYPGQYDAYYNDHAPFRAFISAMWSKLNYRLFGDSVNSAVVVGKTEAGPREAWLFYNSAGDNSPVKDTQGLTEFSDELMDTTVKNLQNNTKILAKKGIKYYALVVPSKENIYREYLPDTVIIYTDEMRGEKMVEKIQSSGVNNFVYAKDEILAGKNAGAGQLYHKHDTHWNALGAYYGYRALMKKVAPDFKLSGYDVEYEDVTVADDLDLSRFLNMQAYFADKKPVVHYLDDKTYDVEITDLKGEEMVVATNKNAPIKKTVMLVGDSYRKNLWPYLAKTYTKVIVVHHATYDDKFLEKYKPDVFISERVERYIGGLATCQVLTEH